MYHVLFGYGGTVQQGRATGTAWSSTTAVGPGSQATAATAGSVAGIAYRSNTGEVIYREDLGAGLGAPMTVGPGTKPAVALLPGGKVAVAFLEDVAGVNQVALWTDAESP